MGSIMLHDAPMIPLVLVRVRSVEGVREIQTSIALAISELLYCSVAERELGLSREHFEALCTSFINADQGRSRSGGYDIRSPK